MKKVVYIISKINYSLGLEWTLKNLDTKYDLYVVLLSSVDSKFENNLRDCNINVKRIKYLDKKDSLKVFFQILFYLIKIHPDVVHTHMIDANILGLTAARLCFVRKRIYTRHHGSLHHITYKSGLKWDKLCNKLSTNIVSISKNVSEILIKWEKVPENKVCIIYHGFDLKIFNNIPDSIIAFYKNKYNEENCYPIIGVVARFAEWKGIQYIIKAFSLLLKDYPNAKLLMFNAVGDYSQNIFELLKELPEKNWQTVEFEQSISCLYSIFDVYVHTPIDEYSEAFGQTYIESLASGAPSVFSLSGIAKEFVINNYNALTVPFKDFEQIYFCMKNILTNNMLKDKLILNGKESVKEFSLEKMIKKLEVLYD